MIHCKHTLRPAFVRVLLAVVLALALPASAEWKEKVLYSFQGGQNDGSVPAGGVVFDKQGYLYGATYSGSPYSGGIVFQLAPQSDGTWIENVLYVFRGRDQGDGDTPNGGLIIDSAGNLYGVTAYGGTGNCVLLGILAGCGAVYELSPPKEKGGAWTETILYSFPTAKEGYLPNGNLVFDRAGSLYGATTFGGTKGATCDPFYGGQCGVVFELSPPKNKDGAWMENVLHNFAGSPDGANPNGGLVLDNDGAVYGTAYRGGNQACNYQDEIGCGIAFKLKPPAGKRTAWAEEKLHTFSDGNDGAEPNGGLLFDAKGRLYGTAGGGSWQDGVVFRLAYVDGHWKERALYSFRDGDDGLDPGSGLVFDRFGYLYGVALGGQTNKGLVFRLKPPKIGGSWSLSVLHDFMGAPDGNHPTQSLVFRGTSKLFGVTDWGGNSQGCQGGCGIVFEVQR